MTTKSAFGLALTCALLLGCEREHGVPGDHAAAPGEPPKTLTLDLGSHVTMSMVLIPAGRFVMGSPSTEKGFGNDQGPPRQVTITKPFYLGLCEVMQEQYQREMGVNPSLTKAASNPVENVSRTDALAFCRKLAGRTGMNIRLPTEAEWEYACRAGRRTPFGFGSNESRLAVYAWYAANSGGKHHPVGSKLPNAWGLYDMHGNVVEWCSDWYGMDYYRKGPDVDPQGPPRDSANLGQGVLRGGSYCDSAFLCRSAWRGTLAPTGRDGNIGFRVVADPKP